MTWTWSTLSIPSSEPRDSPVPQVAPSGLQVDQFLSGEWISVRAARPAYAPRVQRSNVRVLSQHQAKVFLDAVKGDRLEAFLSVALAAGLRLGELLGLRWSDVDLDTGVLSVRQALQRVGKHVRFVEPKSERSRRTVHNPAVCHERPGATPGRSKRREAVGRFEMGGDRSRVYVHHRDSPR